MCRGQTSPSVSDQFSSNLNLTFFMVPFYSQIKWDGNAKKSKKSENEREFGNTLKKKKNPSPNIAL